MEGLASFRAVASLSSRLRNPNSASAFDARRAKWLSLPSSCSSIVRAQQMESKGTPPSVVAVEGEQEPEKVELKIKEWEVGMYHNEVAASQGIRIRRRPPTGPPQHYVGPFEFRLQNEGNTPRNILEEIIWHKDTQVAQVEIAQAYEKGGAACLSVLADEKYFQGSYENMVAIRNAGVKCPLLCKEFIIEAWQIYYARTKGADAILLIAAVLPDLDIRYMTKICKMLGMATLVEVHDEREMDRVLGIEGVELIGINNRNLETFEVDTGNTKKLLEGERGELIRQRDIIVVGESGLFTPDDIAYVQEAGVKAVLVGESIVKQDDPQKGIAELFGKDISL
ncbi:indole-3-glycerol phosphate synthase, chloroplastic-like isoform X3 [Malus domestica]|uniref:indole-3-glycerol phosphate synthase, chloroplastic-like isoform X3 n=1 Tax=Malus domestica TaxID=3750 RepID=UPI003974BC78